VKIKKIDLNPEKKILTNLIVSDDFARQIMPIFIPNYMKSSFCRIVGDWILEYYNNFKCAPGKTIQDIYRDKRGAVRDEEDSDLIADFLLKLSIDYENSIPSNTEYSARQAERYLKTRSIEVLIEDLQDSVQKNDPLTGEQRITKYNRVERATGEGVSLKNDTQEIIDAFDEEEELLFRFPGAVGEVIGDLHRGDFFSFMAPMKRGKCLSKDSEILLSSGEVVTIENLVGRENIEAISLNDEGKFEISKVGEVYDNGIKKIYEVVTRTGRMLKVTSNHPLYSFDKKWISINEGLCKGDFIAVPRKIDFFGNEEIPIDHVRIMAYLLADGCLGGSTPTYTKLDKKMKNEVIRITESFGDKVFEIDELSISLSKGHGCHGPGKSNISKILDLYNFKRCKSIYKEIPPIIFRLKKELVREFLRILFSGDGTIYKFGIEYASSSPVFIKQVQHLLIRFGIVSKIDYCNGKFCSNLCIRDSKHILKYIDEIGFFGKKEERTKEIIEEIKVKKSRSYLDIIPGSYREVIKEKIRSRLGVDLEIKDFFMWAPKNNGNITCDYLRKFNSLFCDEEISIMLNSDILWDKIISIKYVGEEHTYDLSIPKYHNFIANDICAHNTWYLWYTSEIAMKKGLKVAFFTGEMTKRQLIRRAWRSIVGQPKTARTIKIPYFEESLKSKGKFEIKVREEDREGIDVSKIKKQQIKMKRMIRSGDIRIIQIPGYETTVKDIEAHLDNMEHYDNYLADVVIIDYADLLMADKRAGNEHRHQLDNIWKGLRRISQSRNILLVTASQTAKETFDRDIRRGDAAEDIRKIAHVTAAVGINQKHSEIDKGIIRISQLVVREDRPVTDQAVVLQCLDIGRPCIDSKFHKDMIQSEEPAREERRK